MNTHTPYIYTSYLHCMLDTREFDRRLTAAKQILAKYDYDAFAFRGMSGALLAAPLAHILGKTMIMVRKPGVDCHTSRAVEGDQAARRYVIVDDVICTGETVRMIIRAVKRFNPGAECLGLLEWNSICSMTFELESCERFKPLESELYDEFGKTRERTYTSPRTALGLDSELVKTYWYPFQSLPRTASECFQSEEEKNNAKAEACNQQLVTQASQAVLPQAAALDKTILNRRLQRSAKRSQPLFDILIRVVDGKAYYKRSVQHRINSASRELL